jgi:hypothetical protein
MDEQQRQQQCNDRLMASAVKFLIDGKEEKAASLLLSCALNCEEVVELEEEYRRTVIRLTAPRAIYEWLTPLNANDEYYSPEFRARFSLEEQEKFVIGDAIREAFHALLGVYVFFSIRASYITMTEHWREELLALIRGDTVTNQGLPFGPQHPVLTWNNLRFRSASEIRIAEALERAQVLFLPNCMARLGFSHRENREADFLICHKGKWGILEVDHPFTHPPSRKVHDDERARLFKAHGIRLVEHFDAGNCLEDADGIVRRFLYLLGQ